MSTTSCIPPNPDISGIGVRAAVYVLNLLSLLPAATAIVTGWRVSKHELRDIEEQSVTILISAFALLVSTAIQTETLGLTNYHVTVILNLSWINNTNTFIYLLLWFSNRLKGDELETEGEKSVVADPEAGEPLDKKRTYFQKLRAEAVPLLKNEVAVVGSLHLTFMAAVGLWLWIDPEGFGSGDTCLVPPIMSILGIRSSLSSQGLRVWSLFIYGLLLVPVFNVFVPCALFCALFRVVRVRLPPQSVHIIPAFFGLGLILLIIVAIIADTELTIDWNRVLLEPGDGVWTFGQTLALLLLIAALRSMFIALWQKHERKVKIQESLFNAAKAGELADAKSALKHGASLHTLDHQGETPLVVAALHRKWAFVQYFVHHEHSDESCSPKQADLDVILLLAADEGEDDTVSCLLKNGASVNSQDRANRTAIMHAASRKMWKTVTALVDYGADPTKRDPEGLTVTERVLNAEEWSLSRLIASKILPRVSEPAEGYALREIIWRAAMEHWPTLEFLADKGVDFNLKNSEGYTVLLQAVQEKRWITVGNLVRAGARLDPQDPNTKTIRTLAARDEDWELVQCLIDQSEDAHIHSQYSVALLQASQKGKLEIVKALLHNGAAVDFTDDRDKTPLWLAVEAENREVVQCLAESHANVNVTSNTLTSPSVLGLAAMQGSLEIVKILVNHGANMEREDEEKDTPIIYAARSGKAEIVEFLAKNNVRVDVRGEGGFTPLMQAAYWGHLNAAKVLVENGASLDITSANISAETALDVAVRRQNPEVVKFLQGVLDQHATRASTARDSESRG